MSERKQKSRGLDTVAVRGGEAHSHAYHAVTMPIVCTSTYSFDSSQDIRDYFDGKLERGEYGRYGNPTVRVAETKLSALEQSEDTVLFPSGMSAVTTLLFAMLKPGDHIVMTSDAYRRTRQFIKTTLAKFGVEHTFVSADDYNGMAAAIKPKATRLIITEAPTNPNLRVVDIERVAAIKRDVPGCKLLVDTTLATPANFRPLECGADFVLHSATKYLAGHNDVLAGAICGAQPLIDALRDARGVFGCMPDPHGAYLLIRGMKSFAVRMRQHNENGMKVAGFLEAHPRVERVFFPGLESHPDYAVAVKQFKGGYGSVISFLVRGSLDETAAFVDAIKLANIAPSMGGIETLIEQPALMSFYELSSAQRAEIGIPDNLIRLSVGLEDADDIIADLDTALRSLG